MSIPGLFVKLESIARRIYATDMYALENLKELGVEPSDENSSLTLELGEVLAEIDRSRNAHLVEGEQP